MKGVRPKGKPKKIWRQVAVERLSDMIATRGYYERN